MFKELKAINSKPAPFEFYTADELWTDEHTSKQMLAFHLNESIDLSSRNRAFIETSATWIISHFGVGADAQIADFGCGPGLYTIRFAKTGADVTGIDFSGRSIQYARNKASREGLSINYVHQNYLEFDTEEQFDLITMIFCDFCALSPSQRKMMLTKFFKLLKPNGAVLLDVHSLNTFTNREETATYEKNLLDGFWSPNDYYGFLNIFKYEKEKITLDKYTIIEKERTRVVYNWLQYFSRESLAREFETAGLAVEKFYADVAGTPFSDTSPDLAIVARKP